MSSTACGSTLWPCRTDAASMDIHLSGRLKASQLDADSRLEMQTKARRSMSFLAPCFFTSISPTSPG